MIVPASKCRLVWLAYGGRAFEGICRTTPGKAWKARSDAWQAEGAWSEKKNGRIFWPQSYV